MGELWDGYELLKFCAGMARDAHKNQYRRDGLTPYIDHPAAVAKMVITFDEKCTAWLPDVLEDTGTTAKDLLDKGVPENIVEAVIALTRRKGESVWLYYFRVKENSLAKTVKLQDMLHNMSDNPTRKQVVKYSKGFLFLLEED